MKKTALVLVLGMLAAAVPAFAAETTLADQKDVAVTVYNSNIGLVRDVREVSLPTGEIELRFMDVAQGIRPETVSIRSLTQEGSVAVLEQNYEFDLITPSKLMEKYVGKEVKLRNFNKDLTVEEVVATLMSVNESPVYKVGDQIYLGFPGQVVLPEIPENLIAKPSLIWLLDNAQATQTLEATYITNGLNWSADYVLTLGTDETKADITGWVTLMNQSGTQYTNAKLKLVAGEVNVVPQEADMFAAAQMVPMRAKAAPPMQEESFAEYHLYTLPRRTTIKQNQTKQVTLLTAAGFAVEKKYEYRGDVSFYSQPIPPMPEQDVNVFLTFQNEEENSLGMPLPAGVVRVYQADSEGMLQFSGEDRINHTPKDEEVKMRLGNAFDIVAERTQTDFQRIADNVYEAAFEVTLRNHKETAVTVDIVEPMPADWQIIEKSHEFTKKDAFSAIFSVPVPQDGEVKVTYRVRVRY